MNIRKIEKQTDFHTFAPLIVATIEFNVEMLMDESWCGTFDYEHLGRRLMEELQKHRNADYYKEQTYKLSDKNPYAL